DTLREILTLDGHDVEVAADGPTAVAIARRSQPEIVVCDIGLPGMDGYAVARAFRKEEPLRGAYLVALTGYAQPQDLELAAAAGFDRHLAKPVTHEELEAVLASVPRDIEPDEGRAEPR